MRGGDISQEVAPGVGFRFERVIRSEEGKIQMQAKAFIQTLWRLDVSIWIITTENERKARQFLWKYGVPHNYLIKVDSKLEVPDVVRENDLLTYYDIDVDMLQNVKARGNGKVAVKQWILGVSL